MQSRPFINREDFGNIVYLLKGYAVKLEVELKERMEFDPSPKSNQSIHIKNDLKMIRETVRKIDDFVYGGCK